MGIESRRLSMAVGFVCKYALGLYEDADNSDLNISQMPSLDKKK